jgi:glycerol-3-phosphate dehydrogenase (NAD(P)+)
VELCGALKNIVALSCGIAGGLGYGDNTRAALITRGMAEITRLGCAMGCQPRTFTSLAGIGDLIVTATSPHSRNNRAGTLMGQGASAKEAAEKVGMVVEGINALPGAVKLAEKYGVDMPIVRAVDAIVAGRVSPADAVDALMQREKKHEFND